MNRIWVDIESGTYGDAENIRIIDIPEDHTELLQAFDEATDRVRAQMAEAFGVRPGSRTQYSYGYSPRTRIDARRTRITMQNFDDVILATREEAEKVLEGMNEIVAQYHCVSVSDFKALIGLQPSHMDEKVGWTSVQDVEIKQVRDGYVMQFPKPEPID